MIKFELVNISTTLLKINLEELEIFIVYFTRKKILLVDSYEF